MPTNGERMLGVLTLECGSALVWLLGILLAAYNTATLKTIQEILVSQAPAPTGGELLVSFLIGLVLLVTLHKQRSFGLAVVVILGYMTFSGLSFVMGIGLAFLVASVLMLYHLRHHSYLSNNALLAAAALFGSFPLALGFSVNMLILILIFFSVYDVIGVFATHFIPNLAHRAVELKLPLLFAAPRPHVAWKSPLEGKTVSALLGAGDVFLPTIFITSVVINEGPDRGLAVLFGTLIGWILNNILAAMVRTGIPAMPLLTVGMLIGYFAFGK